MKDYKLFLGKSEDILDTLPDSFVDSIVTDPPYHLTSVVKRFGKKGSAPAKHGTDGAFMRASRGFMGQEWDGGDIAFQPSFWERCLRVLKPGGHLLAFSGSRTYHRMACAIEDAGFEIRDSIMWLYGSGFPKSHNQGNGWGSALKPAHEPICVARKPLVGTIAENVALHGVGSLNIDGCRVGDEVGGWGGKSGFEEWGSGLAKDQQARPVIGRWPANVIHDGSDEVLAGFPQSSVTGKRSARSKSAEVAGTNWLSDNHESTEYTDSGSAARFFYCPKASKSDREEGMDGFELKEAGIKNDSGRGFSETDPMRKIMRRNTHPTVKPTELMRYLCRLVTPTGGLVLDPFMGSGSTGKAAMLEGFWFMGIDMTEEYVKIAEARIKSAKES